MADSDADEVAIDTLTGPSANYTSIELPTPAAFRRQARALFRRFIPAADVGQLRPYQQEFIARNETRSPESRRWLIRCLQLEEASCAQAQTPGSEVLADPFTQPALLRIEASLRDDA